MNIRLLVEKDSQTGRFSAVFPELPGCASAGDIEQFTSTCWLEIVMIIGV
ncbi:MAG: hypothetical protein MAG581_01279 [Deltaproteobacteria bacterium]|jgi:hypothetical protein|nr:hypothetical protein [Deltaproteobacteria bacterium]